MSVWPSRWLGEEVGRVFPDAATPPAFSGRLLPSRLPPPAEDAWGRGGWLAKEGDPATWAGRSADQGTPYRAISVNNSACHLPRKGGSQPQLVGGARRPRQGLAAPQGRAFLYAASAVPRASSSAPSRSLGSSAVHVHSFSRPVAIGDQHRRGNTLVELCTEVTQAVDRRGIPTGEVGWCTLRRVSGPFLLVGVPPTEGCIVAGRRCPFE